MSKSKFSNIDEEDKVPDIKNPRDRRKKFKGKLPNKIIPFVSMDKLTHESWVSKRSKTGKSRRNLANFPAPFKAILCGQPSCGKTAVAKNIILRAKPMYDNIYICMEYEQSKEWDDIQGEYLNEIPEPSFFNPDEKNCIILEDWETDKRDVNLSKLFRISSSHCKVSIILLYQSWFRTIPLARRLCDVFIIWRLPDTNEMEMIARRIGYNTKDFMELFNTFCKTKYDNICFDKTPKSPAPLRLNIFQPIRKIRKINM